MQWCDFRKNLSLLHPDLWVNLNGPSHHLVDKNLLTFGVYFKDHHVAGVTYGDVPEYDVYNDAGIMTHNGIRTIIKHIMMGKDEYARNMREYWKMGNKPHHIDFYIDPKKIEKIFHVSI